MRLWKASLLVLAAAVAVVIAIVLAGVGNGVALLAYVLFVAALLFTWLIGRLGNVLPLARDFQRLLARPDRPEMPVEQFETVRRLVVLARSSRSDLLAAAAPGARHRRGSSVAALRHRSGARAGASRITAGGGPRLGARAAGLPRQRPDRDAPGWSQRELEQLVEELESL